MDCSNLAASIKRFNFDIEGMVWAQAWDQPGTGLIISERLINCPPQLASPLQHALFDEEIPWATEDEPSEELRNSYKFERFLFVSRVYQDNQEVPQLPRGPKKGKKRKVLTVCHL